MQAQDLAWHASRVRARAHLRAWLSLPAVLLLGFAAQASRAGEAVEPIDFAALSGSWAGTQVMYQGGKCAIGGPNSRHDSTPIRFTMDVADDGSFTLVRESKGKAPSSPDRWLGQVTSDLNLTASEPAHAVCKDIARDYVIAFAGKITNKGGRLALEMEGTDAPCPQMECTFTASIRAKKQ